MALLKVSGDGIEDNAITNAHLHSSAEIAATKLANSGVTAGSYGSGSAIPAITVNAKGLITSVSTSSINTDLVADSSPQLGGDLDLNSNDITGTGNFNITGTLVATSAEFSSTSSLAALIAKGDGSSQDGYIQLNCSQNSHGIKLKSPPHSASQSYTLTFPSDIQNAKFLTTDANGNLSWGTPTDTNTQLSNSQVRAAVEAASDSNVFTDADHSKLNGIEASATADQTASEILTLIKTVDGAGSGLDADTLDGVSSASFLRSDAADTFSGNLTGSSGTNIKLDGNMGTAGTTAFNSMSGYLEFTNDYNDSARGANKIRLQTDNNWLAGFGISANSHDIYTGGNFNFYKSNSTTSFTNLATLNSSGSLSTLIQGVVWGASNDGSGSGLDSDLLDGQEGSYYRNAGNLNAGSISASRIADGSITNAKLATGIDGDKISNLTIDSSELENNCIITDKISNSAVTNAKISSMDASKLTGTVAAARLNAGSTSEAGISVVGNFGQWQTHSVHIQ